MNQSQSPRSPARGGAGFQLVESGPLSVAGLDPDRGGGLMDGRRHLDSVQAAHAESVISHRGDTG